MSVKRQRYSFYYSECVALSLDFINIMMELYSATVTKYYVGAELVSADKYNITVTNWTRLLFIVLYRYIISQKTIVSYLSSKTRF